ncbi:MAG: hypothetical protein LBK47_05195 [Prevotellaceae bacterium]|nr:hypothetical protein [Prevotellaceae bacterium]
MKRRVFCLAVSLGLIIASCGSPDKMKDSADQIKVTCDPAVLEATAGVIKAKITVTFPEKYFHPDAVLEMLPVMKYDGGEQAGTAKLLQGEKVKDNNQVIAAKGGSYTQELQFSYTPELAKSTLEIRPTLIVKGQRMQFPKDIKAADGVIATYTLAQVEVKPVYMVDQYVQVVGDEKEAEIKFVINQSTVRTSELKKEDIKALEQFIAEASKGENNATLKELQISSYASPDGPTELNEKLSTARGKSANDALNQYFKKSKARVSKDLVSIQHTAEDWDGFQALVAASDIQDKELILRVLSMYNDPAIREREIKNMSKVYQVLAEKILPQLRRSKMIAKVEIAQLNDEAIKTFVDANNLDTLNLEQLLYAGNKLYDDYATKIALYRKAAEKFDDARAYNNLGAVYIQQKDTANAAPVLTAANTKKANDLSIKNNLGYLALLQGDKANAEKQLAEAGLEAGKLGLGYLAIGKGDYSNAVTLLRGAKTENEVLALILLGKNEDAKKVLADLQTPLASYLKAIVAVRFNDSNGVTDNLQDASQDATLKARADKDIEFANFAPKAEQPAAEPVAEPAATQQ